MTRSRRVQEPALTKHRWQPQLTGRSLSTFTSERAARGGNSGYRLRQPAWSHTCHRPHIQSTITLVTDAMLPCVGLAHAHDGRLGIKEDA